MLFRISGVSNPLLPLHTHTPILLMSDIGKSTDTLLCCSAKLETLQDVNKLKFQKWKKVNIWVGWIVKKSVFSLVTK